MDEDTADSRTLGVGRKRDLQDATQSQDGEPAREYDSSDEEQQRSRKRAKHSQESSNATGSEDGIIINTASPLQPVEPLSGRALLEISPSNSQDGSVPTSEANVDMGGAPVKDHSVASSEVELPHASPAVQTEASMVLKGASPAAFNNEGEAAQAQGSDNSIIPNTSNSAGLSPSAHEQRSLKASLVTSAMSSSCQLEAKKPSLPSWNGGIQSGLRTSFGSKSRIASKKAVSSFEEDSDKFQTLSRGGAELPDNMEKDDESDSEAEVEDSAKNSSGVGSGSLTQVQSIEAASMPNIPLSKHERALLPAAEQQANKAAHKAMMTERRLQTWDKHTMQAEKALAQEKTWPISNGPILDMINSGKTYYARDVPRPLKYSNDSGIFNVSPVWDTEGKPIKAQDFSFNRFAPAFIKKNLDKAANLNMHDLQSAFHTYCKKGFYRHLGGKCRPLMDTVNADDALTLEQALKLAGVHHSPPNAESDTGVAGLPTSVEGSSQNESQSATAMALPSDSFVVLSKRARGKLTPAELAVYEEKLKEQSVRAATEEADRVIRLVGRWPLPTEYVYVSDSIAKGDTFYARTPKNQKQYAKGGVEYQISEIYDERGIPLKAADFSFNKFVVAFLKQNSNPKKRNTITLQHLKGAFGFYCSKFYNIVSQAIAMRTAKAPDALTLEQAMRLASDATPLPSGTMDKGKSVADDVECMDDVCLQQKYFPSSENISDRCLACAGTGHGTKSCPALDCNFCGMSGDHSNFTCPENGRCQKCRQRGHQTSACPEKLFLSKSEAIPCDLCGSNEHLEIDCHFIWRSFAPGAEVQKAQDIPVHCYTCGGSGHYGPECGLLTRPLRSGQVTWSQSNVQKYIDPISGDRALSAGVDYSIPKPTKQFSIKGMGAASNPYTLDESEEEGEFIRPKINNNAHDRGQIRFGEPSRGNYLPANDSYRPSDLRGAPAMGFSGAYAEDHDPHQMPYGGPSPYQQPSYSSYNGSGQYPDQAANLGRGSHERRMNRENRPPVQNRYPTRQAMAAVANNNPKAKKKKEKKPKKRAGNSN